MVKGGDGGTQYDESLNYVSKKVEGACLCHPLSVTGSRYCPIVDD